MFILFGRRLRAYEKRYELAMGAIGAAIAYLDQNRPIHARATLGRIVPELDRASPLYDPIKNRWREEPDLLWQSEVDPTVSLSPPMDKPSIS